MFCCRGSFIFPLFYIYMRRWNMVNFEKLIINELNKKVGEEYRIVSNIITKQNDEILHSIAILNDGERMSKNIYLESYYEEYKKGRSIDSITEDIIGIIRCKDDIQQKCMKFVEILNDYESVKENLMVKLINKDFNDKYLENKCYISYLDFAVLLYVLNDWEQGESFTVAVTKTLADVWEISIEEMYEQALMNVRNKYPATIENINSLILNSFKEVQGIQEEELDFLKGAEDKMGLYVLSNRKHTNGAISMIFTDVLKKFADENKVNEVIIIPSSVHEVLLYPKNEESDITEKKCLDMLLDVNSTSVEQGELLSNNVYVYNAIEDKVGIWEG